MVWKVERAWGRRSKVCFRAWRAGDLQGPESRTRQQQLPTHFILFDSRLVHPVAGEILAVCCLIREEREGRTKGLTGLRGLRNQRAADPFLLSSFPSQPSSSPPDPPSSPRPFSSRTWSRSDSSIRRPLRPNVLLWQSASRPRARPAADRLRLDRPLQPVRTHPRRRILEQRGPSPLPASLLALFIDLVVEMRS